MHSEEHDRIRRLPQPGHPARPVLRDASRGQGASRRLPGPCRSLGTWASFALLLAAVLLGAGAARANGTLLTKGEDPRPLEVVYQHVGVHIRGRMALTTVTQVFANRTDSALEASYVFPLPGEAAVAGFAAWYEGRRVEATTEEKDQARRSYESGAGEGRAPSLMEQLGDNLFQMDVFDVPARGARRVELRYTELLDYAAGTVAYRFPARFREQVAREIGLLDADIHVEADGPLTFVGSPSYPEMAVERGAAHEAWARLTLDRQTPSRDVDLVFGSDTEPFSLAGRFARGADDDAGSFALSFAFNREPEDAGHPPRSVILAVDTSLSMAGEPLRRARLAAREILTRLRPEDRFELLPFSSVARPVFGGLVERRSEHVQRAELALEGLRAHGGSDLGALLGGVGELLRPAGAPSNDGAERIVVLLTDGHPTLGEQDADRLGELGADALGGAALIVAHLGYPSRQRLLRRLAAAPTYHYIPAGPAGQAALEELATQVSSPALHEVVVRVDGVQISDLHPSGPVTLFEGQQLLVAGRYEPLAEDTLATVQVVARRHDEALTFRYELPFRAHGTDAGVARLWARRQVEHLLARIDEVADDTPEHEALVAEVVRLAKLHRLVTPYTSFLARRPDADIHPDRIKPGDPVITFQAPADARRVVALLPWGEEIPCIYLEDQERWMGRFLVPRGTPPGLYRIRIYVLLQDGAEQRYTLFYRVDQEAPRMRLELAEPGPFAPGDTVVLRAVPIEHVYEGKAVGRDGGIVVRERVDVKRLVVQVFGERRAMHRRPGVAAWELRVTIPEGATPGGHAASLVATDWAGNAHHAEVEVPVAAAPHTELTAR